MANSVFPEFQGSAEDPNQCRLIVIGSGIRALVGGEQGFGNYAEIVAEYPNLESWTNAPSDEADLVVASCPALFPETIEKLTTKIQQTGASRAVVVYEFATAETEGVAAEHSGAISVLRAPVTAAELRSACEADIALTNLRERWTDGQPPELSSLEAEIPARQFSDEQLGKISQISTSIDCECPHHLATLLMSLNAFEKYSLECENRSDEDAVLHAYLHRSTARSRAIIEDALVVIAEAEGFDLN